MINEGGARHGPLSAGPPPPRRQRRDARILESITKRPGVTLADLRRQLATQERNVSRSVLTEALARFESEGAIVSVRSGRTRHFYRRERWNVDLHECAFVQAAGRWPVAVALASESPLTLPLLRNRLPATLDSWQLRFILRSLAARGLVERSRNGRVVSYEATTRLRRIVAALSSKD